MIDSQPLSNTNELIKFHQELRRQIEISEVNTAELFAPVLAGNEIWLLKSKEIIKIGAVDKLTSVPGATKHVAGLVSLQGSIYTVLDLNVVLGNSPTIKNNKARIVFLDIDGIDESDAGVNFALLVERVLALTPAPTSAGEVMAGDKDQFSHMNIIDQSGITYRIANLHKICNGNWVS